MLHRPCPLPGTSAPLTPARYAGRSGAAPIVLPICKLLELSGHGVPWLVATAYVIAAQPEVPSPAAPSATAARQPPLQAAALSVNLMGALLIDLAVVGLCKVSFRRARPAYNRDDMVMDVVGSVDRFSFPSGHTTRAVAMAAVLGAHGSHLVEPAALAAWASAVMLLASLGLERPTSLDLCTLGSLGWLEVP